MDDLDAPKWADFIAPSPPVSLDDFFLRRHDKHEYRKKLDSFDSDSPDLLMKESNENKQTLSDTSCIDDDTLQKRPVQTISSKGKNSRSKNNKIIETTCENILIEAMNNLELSFKKQKGEKSLNKSCLIDSPAFKTTIKRVTRSVCAQVANTSKYGLEESHSDTSVSEKSAKVLKLEHKENKENINLEIQQNLPNENNSVVKECESSVIKENNDEFETYTNEQTSQINLEVTSTSTEHEISHDKLEEEADQEVESKKTERYQVCTSKELPKSKVVTSFGVGHSTHGSSSKKKVTTLTGNAWHRQVKRRMSITNQRQLSTSKASMASKYVSMAEAIIKFERSTPPRFHTTNGKTTRTEQLRRMSFKLTKATSPALTCKNRSRPVTVISRDEQERLELEKIQQNQIKANPLRKDILTKPAVLKKVDKKLVTNPEPFHLTESKKNHPPKQNSNVKPICQTKFVPFIVGTDDKSVIIADEEVLHSGIPYKIKQNHTKVIPFSFEARNKELQKKKQEKLKMMQETEQQKIKAEFHARPVPAAVKTPISKPPSKDNSTNKPKITLTRSLSFEERHKQLQKKKEEKINQMLEEEKKARTFRAQKVPEFKPVMVRGRSRDNLMKRSQENLVIKSHNASEDKKIQNVLKESQENLAPKQKNLIKKQVSIPLVAPKKTNPLSVVTDNQKNLNRGTVPKIMKPKCKLSQKSVAVLSEFNTDKRAKQRKEFDEHLKKKEIDEEEMKRKEEHDRIVKEKAEKLELRKMTEIKARPMPVYKPMNIVKSTKPLTLTQSPAWAKRKRSTQ